MKKVFLFIFSFVVTIGAFAQNIDPSLFNSMKWRMIGPHRGGRTVGAVGVPQQQNVFYIGVNNGGVWKTTDYGHTWVPIFDDQPTGSVGDVAVAGRGPRLGRLGLTFYQSMRPAPNPANAGSPPRRAGDAPAASLPWFRSPATVGGSSCLCS